MQVGSIVIVLKSFTGTYDKNVDPNKVIWLPKADEETLYVIRGLGTTSNGFHWAVLEEGAIGYHNDTVESEYGISLSVLREVLPPLSSKVSIEELIKLPQKQQLVLK
jgi:hypothetical protein